MAYSFQMKGTEDLANALKDKATLDDVKTVVRVNGAELQKSAKRKAPVDTGALERSIELRLQNNNFTARVWAPMHYAPYVEYGTRYMYGRRFMRRAYREQVKKFKRDLDILMK